MTVSIFVPDYGPEHLTFEAWLPITPAELEQVAQQGRDPVKRAAFPHLILVLPQMTIGTVVYVATPHWSPAAVIVLIDTTAIDNRQFAVQAPVYADRALLCDLAHLPVAANIRVFVGADDEHIEDRAYAHLVTGPYGTVFTQAGR